METAVKPSDPREQDVIEPTPADTLAIRRAAFVQGLRDLAAFIESHPGVTCPKYAVMNAFVNTRDEIVANAKAATWEKVYNGEWFYLHRSFGEDVSIDITAERSTVCRKVVTGSKVIKAQPERTIETCEWVCEDVSLLASDPKGIL